MYYYFMKILIKIALTKDLTIKLCWYQCHIVIFYWVGVITKFTTWHQKTYHYHDRSVTWNRHGGCTKVKRGIWGPFKAPSGSQTCAIRARRKLRCLNNSEIITFCIRYIPLYYGSKWFFCFFYVYPVYLSPSHRPELKVFSFQIY